MPPTRMVKDVPALRITAPPISAPAGGGLVVVIGGVWAVVKFFAKKVKWSRGGSERKSGFTSRARAAFPVRNGSCGPSPRRGEP